MLWHCFSKIIKALKAFTNFRQFIFWKRVAVSSGSCCPHPYWLSDGLISLGEESHYCLIGLQCKGQVLMNNWSSWSPLLFIPFPCLPLSLTISPSPSNLFPLPITTISHSSESPFFHTIPLNQYKHDEKWHPLLHSHITTTISALMAATGNILNSGK